MLGDLRHQTHLDPMNLEVGEAVGAKFVAKAAAVNHRAVWQPVQRHGHALPQVEETSSLVDHTGMACLRVSVSHQRFYHGLVSA